MTCVAFSIKFAKTNQKFAENSEFKFVKKIHYYSELFTSLLTPAPAGLAARALVRVDAASEPVVPVRQPAPVGPRRRVPRSSFFHLFLDGERKDML